MSIPTDPRRSTTTSRRAMTAVGVLIMLLGVCGVAMTAGADPTPPVLPSAISVVPDHAALPDTFTAPNPCVRPAFFSDAATATVTTTATTYTVTITAQTGLCDLVTAAVYSMPSNFFYPWPQHLVEAKSFAVDAGVTTITFTRGCGPLQFDVITGDAPAAINPNTGPMPGPLLFSVPWTGFQSWLAPCGVGGTTTLATTSTSTSSSTSTTTTTEAPTSTSTSSSTSTTTTTEAPTSTSTSSSTSTTTTTEAPTSSTSSTVVNNVLPDVLGNTSTTTPSGVEAATATTTPEAVEAATATNSAAAPLAFTGGTSWPLEVGGTLMILGGLGLVLIARRRFA